MRTHKNLLAGLSSAAWSAIVGLAVVPLYLKYLGLESYGLIGFFATLQALLVLLDFGVSPTINREVARYSASGKIADSASLLHTLAMAYWGMALLIALTFILLAPVIAEYWLQLNTLPYETVVNALVLMGFVVACRWPSGLYQSAIVGAQRLTVSSAINVLNVTLGSFGAVAILVFVSPTIQAFFLWQIGVAFLYAISMRFAAWWIIGGREKAIFNFDEIKRIWRFSAGMGMVAAFGVILMQLDKILLSKSLNLEEFGGYTLAKVVASSLLVILMPVFNVIYPRLSALVATGGHDALIEIYRSGSRLLSAIIFSLALSVAFFSEDLIYVWTGNLELALSIAPIVSLLIIGTAINGVMIFPYALQLAHGLTYLPLMIVVALIIIYVPLISFLVMSYHTIGGALAWVLLNCIYLIFGTWMTHRQLLKGVGFVWLTRDVIAPFCLALVVVIIGWGMFHEEGAYIMNSFISGGLAICAFFATVLLLQADMVEKMWRQYVVEYKV